MSKKTQKPNTQETLAGEMLFHDNQIASISASIRTAENLLTHKRDAIAKLQREYAEIEDTLRGLWMNRSHAVDNYRRVAERLAKTMQVGLPSSGISGPQEAALYSASIYDNTLDKASPY